MAAPQRPAEGFNRTFMELKQHSFEIESQTVNGFNRTFMELKRT